MLIQLIMSNPLLHGYSVIMIDDVHERTVNTDLLLALVKKILRKRKDVKLIISSATLSAKEMADYFTEKNNKASILSIKGRTFQVDVGSYF
jgi:ATP-dependent RNA helicase DDX35